ncbi:hypothetical protein KM043_010721 [Ampulex compressa]|nr:hypothetical protein KM043_010721 [Ampulex compressa]
MRYSCAVNSTESATPISVSKHLGTFPQRRFQGEKPGLEKRNSSSVSGLNGVGENYIPSPLRGWREGGGESFTWSHGDKDRADSKPWKTAALFAFFADRPFDSELLIFFVLSDMEVRRSSKS